MSKDPSVEDVHKMRVQARRLEAVAAALMLDRQHETHRLLKQVTPLRKAAGKVRDLDVLTANAAALSQESSRDSMVRLIEHLGAKRIERAKNLHEMVADRRSHTERELKWFSKMLQKLIGSTRPAVQTNPDDWPLRDVTAAALELTRELAHHPELGAKTIHSFRIKAKMLRYILELYDDADPELLKELGDVKDKIGDWHDWEKLAKNARKMLDPAADTTLLKQIDEIVREKLEVAIAAANAMRGKYLVKEIQGGLRKQPKSVRPKVSVDVSAKTGSRKGSRSM